MADQYPPSHHQSHHHHQHYQPPSPASSTDSRSNSSNERNQYPRNSSSSPIKPTIPPPTHPTIHNSNLDRSSTAAGNNTQGFNADAVYPPPYSSSSSSHYPRPSPPPEHQVAYPTGPPGQNPSPYGGDYPYQQQHSSSTAAHHLPRHLSPAHQANSPHPPHPSWNPHHSEPPVQPQGHPSGPDDPNAQVDQLADDHQASSGSAPPPVISPPPSPPPGSITLTAPNVPYHPRIQYPISSPGSSDQPSSRQYSFVSLPGNAMRKRPRRKFDEIERLYSCNFPGCTKAYGTLNHLNAHVSMQRHGPKRTPGEFKDMRRARKQAQREHARAAAAREHQNEADDEDNGSPGAGPSTSPASGSRTKRKIRRATEPALQVPRIASLDQGGPSMPEEFGRIAQASRQQQQLEINRRVSMDDYALQHGLMDRRGSGESGDGDTQGDDLTDEPGPSTQRILGPPATMPSGPMGSTEQPLGLHGATTTSPPPLVPSGQLPPMSMEPQTQSMQFWQHQQPSSVAAQHQAPISPTTVVAPHVSHLPGPGPAVGGMGLHASSSHHHRQPSWPPSGAYGGPSTSQQVAQQSGLPPLVPGPPYSSHHQNPLPFPLQPSVSASQQTQSPHLQSHQAQSQAHIQQHSIGVPTPSPPRSAPQTQAQHFQAQQQQYSASPPPPATSPMHRLHQGSMLLTPLNVGGQSHRQSYAQDSAAGTASTQPSAYGQTTIGGAAGASSSAQGLPSVFELENLSRDQTQEQRGSIQQQQHSQQPAPVVQQSAATPWESYQGSSSYPAAGPAHRAPESYAQPLSLGRAVGYDPSRDYYPSANRPDLYGGQRNVVYGAAVPQSRPEAHPAAAAAAYGHPQRSVSYSAAGTDPYMVPGPPQRGGEPSYIPARSESYSGVPSRGDPGAAYASAPGGGRSDPYGTQRPAEQQQQPQYQTIPPPQGHIPSHAHHPGLHPQHLPSSDPAHPDPRHDPYGRGHPGPSEGPY
ncbi:hypothetical protein M407DRAFT_24072 [Tulasnella calospora MUT 4182]|uniref:C2H2-type domain-containing protein n=1 Tax=Tulasnella calospora MUT 4182 TaxID=1051891 RepID=A0A0C3KZ14_9AGAM|nr:hypothetical protein M407DRAFT_24072 [Tulasnella calospora MUT 4182]